MNKRRAKESGLIKALILSIGVASVARAGIAYLPLTGPPALRMLAVKSPKPAPVENISTAVKVTTTNMPDVNVKSCVDTNAVELSAHSGTAEATNFMMMASASSDPLMISAGGPVFAPPAQDFTGITPQMLVTYFQPGDNGTNGANANGPFHINFIPPFAEPDKSSHAKYTVK